jgi:hypothetical protein
MANNDINASNAPEKTGETIEVSNDEFMRATFGDDLSHELPLVVSFQGHPGTGKPWGGKPWWPGDEEADEIPLDANNYFSLASFRPDEAGRYRRQKARFVALYAVMLDDIGTKVDMERPKLPSSWLIETSEGNYQAGYILKEPIEGTSTADRLMNAIVDAKLCDPGANGPRARLARLPTAVNAKHSPPFKCRVEIWEPERRYTVDELADGLQIDMEAQKSKSRRKVAPSIQADDGDPVLLPKPEKHPVLVQLRARGLYKKLLGGTKHDITCPWVCEHTDSTDGGTAYFDPDDAYPIGGFKCLHGHCAERSIKDLLAYLEVESCSARMKPTIRVFAGEIPRVVDAAELELADTLNHYQRGGLIVTVVRDPGTLETRVQELSQPALMYAMAGVATWESYNPKTQEIKRIDPPGIYVSVLYNLASYPHLPVLNGLTRQPYLRPDGSLMFEPGYDPLTGMYGVFNAKEFSISDYPTYDDALKALELLTGLLEEFQFLGANDMATALSAMLTAAVRPSLSHAPMFHVRAHMAGSGKSYLCELMTAFVTPQRSTPTTFPRDDEECRKLLLTKFLRAPAVVEFDNLTSDLLAHNSLCTALTSEYMTGRILGVSKEATVNTRALFLSSGNNVGPIQDMTRRCLTINLAPECEIPAARKFKRPGLVREILQGRGKYVSAALTVVRAWITAGKPKAAVKSMAGFNDWSDLCRQPLLWLGLDDPASSIFTAMADDPDKETLSRLLTAWEGVFDSKPASVRDILDGVFPPTEYMKDLRELTHDIAEDRGQINRRRLGRWFKRHEGRIVDGIRRVHVADGRSTNAWRVERVE